MADLHGIMVALITPFTDDQTKIDEARLQAHIEHLIKAGVHGLVPGGSTGEFTVMTTAERKQLTELCVKFAAGRVPVVTGTGSTSSAEAIELSKHAGEAGAAAVMVVPPFYDPLNLEQLHELFQEIHNESKLPIMFYNIPSASGLKLTPAEIAGLSKVGVKYMKDTSGDAPALTELLVGYSDKITAFNGWDSLTFFGLASGAPGGVWGAANFIPELAVELYEAVSVRGDLKRGRELWAKAWPICKFLESHNYASAVKTGVELIGQPTGGLRKPFALLKPELRAELKQLIENAGVKTI
ncbi:Aldolase-type TIM barrel [Penicillium longicatenatum]|uniref:Aldolase-type TIM barrel n=1 Tax=Penicillium longicatenatum TaxID=1561947 RepID=UPI002547D112|nr:Aldolase-type TIM barrel [Penicillium longicatenatum]KAJ5635133.1 Aldolase-type TIM barrel [Penicillium longicatenatum]